jgi:hypothetical protein
MKNRRSGRIGSTDKSAKRYVGGGVQIVPEVENMSTVIAQ